ncbi:DUF6680 family protein [Nitratireductor indicus]|uniref:DUF6680 family protein n=1 Tax=Nitratireductor indicus TaxID=721133 RepID=UPI002875F4D5|nr:DUF6680 family protein [Nitratireductor indicus]MDS1135976.1 hypothetical protein [Nitratireductor indicus]
MLSCVAESFRSGAVMRTRRTPIAPDFVGALNLVEIEFQSDKPVLDAFKNLMRHFGTEHPRRQNEQTGGVDDAGEIKLRDERFDKRLWDERAALIAKLLHSIAKALNFKIEQLEIFEGGYSPQGWQNIENEQWAVRRYIIDLALGRRVVPVALINIPGRDSAAEAPPADAQGNNIEPEPVAMPQVTDGDPVPAKK